MNAPAKGKKGGAYHHGDLRAALIEQAVALIQRRGDMHFSLRDLATEVGVSHVATYRHFADKAALIDAVAVRGFSILAQALRDAAQDGDTDPAQQLARQAAAYLAMARDHPGHFAAMFAPTVSQDGQSAEMRDASELAYSMILATTMRKLKDEHVASPAAHRDALRCWAMVHGLACLQLSGNLSACLGRDLNHVSEVELQEWLAGLLG